MWEIRRRRAALPGGVGCGCRFFVCGRVWDWPGRWPQAGGLKQERFLTSFGMTGGGFGLSKRRERRQRVLRGPPAACALVAYKKKPTKKSRQDAGGTRKKQNRKRVLTREARTARLRCLKQGKADSSRTRDDNFVWSVAGRTSYVCGRDCIWPGGWPRAGGLNQERFLTSFGMTVGGFGAFENGERRRRRVLTGPSGCLRR